MLTVAPHCRTKIQGERLDPHVGGGNGRIMVGDGWVYGSGGGDG